MKERITKIIQKEEMTAAQFAEKIGLSPSSLSHILNGRNNPSLDVVMKIHKACTYVNLSWLLYGDGQMEEQAKAMEVKEFTATAGGGAIEVTVTGNLLSLTNSTIFSLNSMLRRKKSLKNVARRQKI